MYCRRTKSHTVTAVIMHCWNTSSDCFIICINSLNVRCWTAVDSFNFAKLWFAPGLVVCSWPQPQLLSCWRYPARQQCSNVAYLIKCIRKTVSCCNIHIVHIIFALIRPPVYTTLKRHNFLSVLLFNSIFKGIWVEAKKCVIIAKTIP